jgi:hypothetical protein
MLTIQSLGQIIRLNKCEVKRMIWPSDWIDITGDNQATSDRERMTPDIWSSDAVGTMTTAVRERRLRTGKPPTRGCRRLQRVNRATNAVLPTGPTTIHPAPHHSVLASIKKRH